MERISRHPDKDLKTNLWDNIVGAPTSQRLDKNLVSYFLQWKLTIFEFIFLDVTFCVLQKKLEMLKKSGRASLHHGPSPTTQASWRNSDGFSRERSKTSCSTLRLPSLRYSPHQKQTNKNKTVVGHVFDCYSGLHPVFFLRALKSCCIWCHIIQIGSIVISPGVCLAM